MINSVIFSPSGTTLKVATLLAGFLESESKTLDITVTSPARTDITNPDDLVVFAMPVYAGRIPSLAVERLKHVNGNGQKAVAVVVYGNRNYDDALVELCDIATERGFKVVAAGAFIAEHCIFPKVATGRPDSEDIEKIKQFSENIRHAVSHNRTLNLSTVNGNRPYKKAAGAPLHPEVDKRKCNSCGTCAKQCPTGAIDIANPRLTYGNKCMTCCRCISVCPQDARHIGGIIYKIAGWKFVKDNRRRREPEWFV